MNLEIIIRYSIFFLLWAVFLFPSFFIPRKYQYKKLWPLFSRFFISSAKFKLHDHTKIDTGKYSNAIYIANHRSFVDPFFLVKALIKGNPFTIVVKQELVRYNLFYKFVFKKMGFIALDRDNPLSHVNTIKKTEEFLGNGHSVIIFPEGCYNFEKPIGKLKRGIIKIARESGAYVVPVGIYGIEKNLLNGKKVRWNDIHIKAIEPVKYEDYNDDEKFVQALANKIEHVYLELEATQINKN